MRRHTAILRGRNNQGMQIISGVPEAKRLPADIRGLDVDPALLRTMSKDIRGEFFCLNPSVAIHQGELRTVVRMQFRTVSRSRNIIGRIDGDWQLTGAKWMRDCDRQPKNSLARCLGFEDCRLFSWNDRLGACATVCDRVPGDPFAKIGVLDLSDAGDVTHVHVQESRRLEKNWMPFVQDGNLKFVYSVDPHVLVQYDRDSHRVQPSAADIDVPDSSTIRGGSQLVPYAGGYLAVVHTVHAAHNPYAKHVYLHQLVLFDSEARPIRRSEPFYFEHHGLEFCAGLALWRDGFVLSYGMDDRYPRLALVNRGTVERMVGVS